VPAHSFCSEYDEESPFNDTVRPEPAIDRSGWAWEIGADRVGGAGAGLISAIATVVITHTARIA
jgi:hypothetical protein